MIDLGNTCGHVMQDGIVLSWDCGDLNTEQDLSRLIIKDNAIDWLDDKEIFFCAYRWDKEKKEWIRFSEDALKRLKEEVVFAMVYLEADRFPNWSYLPEWMLDVHGIEDYVLWLNRD